MGNGKKITGINVNAATLDNAGLFGVIEGATLDGVVIEDASITAASNCGGLVGCVSGSAEISNCRADGYVSGHGNTGGFVGCINGSGTVNVMGCVARGDVRSTNNNYGGFIGYISNGDATFSNCWCSGAVWGTGGNIGAFVGYNAAGTFEDCSVYPYGPGPRLFSGSNQYLTGGVLSATDYATMTNGWPEVKKHTHGLTPIATAEQLQAIADNETSLAGCYVLVDDIDLDGIDWTPIGNADTPFTGEFYGQGHRISNYTVETTEPFAGLFGNIAGGRVNGVLAENGTVSRTGDTNTTVGVGGFAGFVSLAGRIANAWCSGEVWTEGIYLGAFVGQAFGKGLVTNSYYDIWPNAARQAAGTGSTGSTGYDGITGLDDMSNPDNFEGFDFVATWTIYEYANSPVFRRGQQHVTFDPVGGTCTMESYDYAIGGYYEDADNNGLPEPVRPGYSFLGWFDDYGIQITDESIVTFDTNRTLHAQWFTIPWTGTGTEDDPYTIIYPSQLDLLATNVNNGESYIDTYFQLGADIAYDPQALTIDNDGDGNGDSNYTPIGYCELIEEYDPDIDGTRFVPSMLPFAGHFDGANHVVSGIRIYKGGTELATDCNQGLFGVIGSDFSTAEVKNVILADAHITGYENVGGIVGMSYFGAVSNCHVLSNVTIDAVQSDASWHGGIMGSNAAGSVTGCTSVATVTITHGCIVGDNGGTVSDCLYLGTAIALSDDEDNSVVLTLLTQRTAALTAVERTTPLNAAIDVTLSGRKLYKDGAWNTLCLPFSVVLEGSPLEGAEVRTLSSSTFADGTLTLDFTPATGEGAVTSIEAGKPYIIKWGGNVGGSVTNNYNQGSVSNSNDITNPVFTGVTIDNTTAPVETNYVDFIGTFSPVALTPGDKSVLFLGAENTLYWPNAANCDNGTTDDTADDYFRLNANRAYFQLKNGLTAGNPALSRIALNFSDENITEVKEVSEVKEVNDNSWYSLDGRRLGGKPSQKGLYIHGGHTVVIK